MVSDATKEAVWSGFLDAARVSRYYAAVGDKHLLRKYWREGTTALVGILAAVSFVIPSLEFLVAVAGFLLIAVVIVDKFLPNQASLLSSVDVDLSRIADRYETLFRETNADQIDETTAKYVQSILEDSINRVCARVDIPLNESLRDKTQADAFKVEAAKFA